MGLDELKIRAQSTRELLEKFKPKKPTRKKHKKKPSMTDFL